MHLLCLHGRICVGDVDREFENADGAESGDSAPFALLRCQGEGEGELITDARE